LVHPSFQKFYVYLSRPDRAGSRFHIDTTSIFEQDPLAAPPARLEDQRAGDADALALAAGELMRIAPRLIFQLLMYSPLTYRRPRSVDARSVDGRALAEPIIGRGAASQV